MKKVKVFCSSIIATLILSSSTIAFADNNVNTTINTNINGNGKTVVNTTINTTINGETSSSLTTQTNDEDYKNKEEENEQAPVPVTVVEQPKEPFIESLWDNILGEIIGGGLIAIAGYLIRLYFKNKKKKNVNLSKY